MKILSYKNKSYFSLTKYGCPNGGSFLLFPDEYFEDSRRFCVKCGCKTKSLDDSTSGTKKSKSLNEYVEENSNEKGGFFKVKFQLSKKNSKDLRKVSILKTYYSKF